MSIKGMKTITYLVIFFSLVTSVKLVKDIFRLWKADERIIEAEKELSDAKSEQVRLNLQLEEVGSDFWKEKQIRDVLKMAKPNEVVVVVPDEITKNTEIRNKTGEISEEKSNAEKWWGLFVY